jgi:fatty-acid desaturase
VADSPGLTPEQAQAAIQEAGTRAAQVRRSDLQLSWILQALAGGYLGVAAVASAAPDRTAAFVAVMFVIIMASVAAAAVLIGLRIRAYTRTGLQIFVITAVVFNVWNAATAAVSIGTRFWATSHPSYHFAISALIAIVPLLAGAAIIWRRAA